MTKDQPALVIPGAQRKRCVDREFQWQNSSDIIIEGAGKYLS
jgi:hypothetical protein